VSFAERFIVFHSAIRNPHLTHNYLRRYHHDHVSVFDFNMQAEEISNRTGSADAFTGFGVEEREVFAADEVAFIAVERRVFSVGNQFTGVRTQIDIGMNLTVVPDDKSFHRFIVALKSKGMRHAVVKVSISDNHYGLCVVGQNGGCGLKLH
jgi:hypothetical protein